MNDESAHLVAELIGRLRSPLDPVLTDPTRLRIQAALRALPAGGAMSFTAIGKVLKVTDGNLGVHLRILVDAGFLDKQEHWRGKRRTTLYCLSAAGRAAFEAHVRALEAIIGASDAVPITVLDATAGASDSSSRVSDSAAGVLDSTAGVLDSSAVAVAVPVPAVGLAAPTQRQ